MSIPAIYSSIVISFSLQKSCKCLVKLAITFRILSLAFGPVALMTFSVKLGSKRDWLAVVPLTPLVPLGCSSSFDVTGTRVRGSSTFPADILDGTDGGMLSLVSGGRREKTTSLIDEVTKERVSSL